MKQAYFTVNSSVRAPRSMLAFCLWCVFVPAVVLLPCSVGFAQNPVCGAVLTQSTTLVGDLDCSSYVGGPVLEIGADNITLDLGGFTLTANDVGTAVLVSGRSGITIKNGNIRGGAGIAFSGTTNANVSIMDIDASWTGVGRIGNGILGGGFNGVTIQHVTASNREQGVNVGSPSSNLTVENSTFDNCVHGVYVVGTNGLTLTNTSTQNGITGVRLESVTGTISISNINVAGSSSYGVWLGDQNVFPTIVPGMFSGLTNAGTSIVVGGVTSNIHIGSDLAPTLDLSWTGSATETGNGVQGASFGSLAIQNVTANNREQGVNVGSPSSNLTVENSVFDNSGHGVYVIGTNGLTLTNISTQNGVTGARLESVTGTISISNVNVAGNSGYGVRLTNQNAFPTIVPGMFSGLTNAGTAIVVEGVTSNIHIGSNLAPPLDLSWTGSANQTGNGIQGVSFGSLTVQNVTAGNRSQGIQVAGSGSNVTIENSTLSGNTYGVYESQIPDLLFFDNKVFNNSAWNFFGDQGYNLWNPVTNEGNFWGHTNPLEPCFFQFGGAFTPFDANRADILDLNCFYTPNTGTGTIAGKVKVGSQGLANVIVKLLDSDGHTIPAFPAVTTSGTGAYSFTNALSGDYQVMIVEPLDYTVDLNPKEVALLSGGSVTLNFILTREVRSNHARSAEYWKNEFDEHRCHGHHCEERDEDMTSYIAAIHEHYDPHFNIFQSLTTIDDWDDVLSLGRHATTLDKAKQELAAMLLNLVSLKVGQYTKVTRDNRTAGEVLTYVSQLVMDGISSNDALARDLARKVNNQDMINAGIVPASNILYKSAGDRIVWTFDIPKEYALSQNYPNPFNPSTTISYDMPNDGRVSLKVFNYLGQEVATLVNEERQAGRYQLSWDASGHASGMYIYKIQADNYTQTRKMLLIK